jgi:hypothetical protein
MASSAKQLERSSPLSKLAPVDTTLAPTINSLNIHLAISSSTLKINRITSRDDYPRM